MIEIEECLEDVCCIVCEPKEGKNYTKKEKQDLEKKAEGILKLGELYLSQAEKKIDEEKKQVKEIPKKSFFSKKEDTPSDFKHVNRFIQAVEHQHKEETIQKDKQENQQNDHVVVTEEPKDEKNNLQETGVGLDVD